MDTKKIKLEQLIREPITVTADTPLKKIREIMLKNKAKKIIVIKNQRPIGIITERDIAKKIYNLNGSMTDIKAIDFKSKLFTLQSGDTVSKCAKMMKMHKIGAVIITSKGKIKGIVSKTDLITILSQESHIKVSDIMKSDIVTAAPDDPILYIEKLLIKYRISRIVIKKGQKPVGIITFRDFVPAKVPQWIAENADPKEIQQYKYKKGLEEVHSNELSYLFPFHASDIMTKDPITIRYDKELGKAVKLMNKHHTSGLPVTKGAKLVGIITKSDIVNILV